MALIGRILVIFFALMLASIAAGIVIALGLLGPQWRGFTGDPVEQGGFWLLVFFASGFTWAAGLLPLVIAIAVAESAKIRSALAYIAGGAVLLVLGYFGSGFSGRYEESIDRAPPPVSRESEIAAAAGAAFGLVYWTIAGRKAGAWRER